jgi:hypothetical protein
MKRLHLAALATTALPLLAQAHDGHGLAGSHWHATDALGLGVALIAAIAAVWLGRQ